MINLLLSKSLKHSIYNKVKVIKILFIRVDHFIKFHVKI